MSRTHREGSTHHSTTALMLASAAHTARARWARWGAAVGMAVLTGLTGTASMAQSGNDPQAVQVTLEGCRNNGTIVLPDGNDRFLCPNAAYTTGNLGKGWNELDLVPHRLTLQAGGNAPATQTYTMAVAVDNFDTQPGYDRMSAFTLNTTLSSGSCLITSSPPRTVTPGVGGTDTSLVRDITVTQSRNSTCVFDFYARLAIDSHLYPGASLHANALNRNLGTAGVGARDVSIPVKEITAQGLRKDMSASQGGATDWALTKVPPADISLGDVCTASNTLTKEVTFRVEWKKLGVAAGKVNVLANIYAYNPASRPIEVSVVDVIRNGTTVLDTSAASAFQLVPRRTEVLVATHQVSLDPSVASVGEVLNDIVTASYRDPVEGDTLGRTISATASATVVQGDVTDSVVSIADVEQASGGVRFAVASPALGSFLNGYVAGSVTTGPVNWGVSGQSASGAVSFAKTVSLDGRRVVNGSIVDTATLVSSTTGGLERKAGPFTVKVTSSASVSLAINKSIPADFGLDAGERVEVTFKVTRASDPTYLREFKLTFVAGTTSLQAQLTGLVPDEYKVEETSARFFTGAADTTGVVAPLNPVGGTVQTQNLQASANGNDTFETSECAGSVSFVNRSSAGPAQVKVGKITEPTTGLTAPEDTVWTFALISPSGATLETLTATANGPAVMFTSALTVEGTYTVVETKKEPAWVLKDVAPDANADKICEFKVDFPEDGGRVFACSFTNQKQGRAKVIKTQAGAALTGAASFSFELRTGASTTTSGTVIASGSATAANAGAVNFAPWLVPGAAYQLCEVVMPGWDTSLMGDGPRFVPASMLTPILPNPNVSNETVCVPFTVTAGQVRAFNVDNTPPPGGLGRTIGFWKNWTSCDGRGKQAPVLDNALANAEPTGIVVSAAGGSYGAFTGPLYRVLHGTTATPDAAVDCQAAIALLDKSTIDTGRKSASDPAFNLAAQLVAAQLNYANGANRTVTSTISAAVVLLGSVKFDGITHTSISKQQAALMNSYATLLDNYNNNR
jgi:hypothetical protein